MRFEEYFHIDIRPPVVRYFCPIILESSLPEHNRKNLLLSTVSSSADSGVHSSYAQSPRSHLHNISIDQDNPLYETYDQTRDHQYSLV
jgi:hypothetical protein